MLWHFYIRKNTAFIPTTAQTEAGAYLEIEPVQVEKIEDTKAIKSALYKIIIKGNPKIPTPLYPHFPKPVVRSFAKVKSLSEFERTTECWEVFKTGNTYAIQRKKRRHDGGWEDNPSTLELLPEGSNIDDLIQRVIDRIINKNK